MPKLRADAENDRDLLREFQKRGASVRREDDPKLKALATQLLEILAQAQEESFNAQDERDKRKVVVFSYFADTAEWIL